MRDERTAEFQRAMEEHRLQLKKINEGDDSDDKKSDSEDEIEGEEWEGFEDPPPVDYEAEYIDEDKYTTVTVEEMDASREGLLKSGKVESSDEEEGEGEQQREAADQESTTAPTKKRAKESDKPKKKRKFRYESKEERKLNQMKHRLSNKKKAAARRER